LNICFDVKKLSQFRVASISQFSPSQGLLFYSSSTVQLEAQVDVHWEIVFIHGNPLLLFILWRLLISYKFKKQYIMSKSSTKVKYRAFESFTSKVTLLTTI
ncbi:hypothetical protein CR513_17576, partial [Mucuna pruriens]